MSLRLQCPRYQCLPLFPSVAAHTPACLDGSLHSFCVQIAYVCFLICFKKDKCPGLVKNSNQITQTPESLPGFGCCSTSSYTCNKHSLCLCDKPTREYYYFTSEESTTHRNINACVKGSKRTTRLKIQVC